MGPTTTQEYPILQQRNLKDERCPFVFDYDRLRNIPPVFYNWHEDIEILCCQSGKGIVKCNGTEFPLSKGETLLIGSMVIHGALPLTQDFSYYCLIINKHFCLYNTVDSRMLPLTGSVKSQAVVDLFDQLARCYEAKEELYELNSRMYVLGIMSQLYQSSNNLATLGKITPHIEDVCCIMQYIDKNYSKNISLEDIAKCVGQNRYYITRVFKEITDRTIFEHINAVRCREAKIRIDSGSSVSSAAYVCGYKSASYFAKVYKKIYGTVPSQKQTDVKTQ